MRWLAVPALLLPLLAAACAGPGADAPRARAEPPPTPRETAERFLYLWREGRYGEMYDLLSARARGEISRERFVDRYQAIAQEVTITGIDYEMETAAEPTPTPEGRAEVAVRVTIHTAFFGDIVQENALPLVEEPVPVPSAPGATPQLRREWRVDWRPSLIFRELDDRSLVHFFPRVPRRGTIYDRQGRPLALDAEVPVVGVVPDLMGDPEAAVAALVKSLDLPEEEVRAAVEADVPSYYFVPVKALPYDTPEEKLAELYALSEVGVVVREEVRRIYPYGDSLAHVLGYMLEVSAEQLAELGEEGFRPGDMVGAFGLEGGLEEVLAGERGGLLATVTPEGTIGRTIAERPARPGKDVYLTIDIEVQRTAEAALGERVGSLVVMDPRDNSVLALASYPRFDPNAFIRGLTASEFAALSEDERRPFLHRPLMATYPPGSTFKVVTMAAALEEGGFSPADRLPCPPVWTGLGPAYPKRNWQSVDRGYLTPAEGLMASCNPVFYEMALALDGIDPEILPRYARAFGFGRPTGIEGLAEEAGVVPDPAWKEEARGEPWYSGDSVNMGIGQGFLTVTPLQIANAYSAIAGGGVLRKPLLVWKIAEPGGVVAQEFQAEEIGPLPVSGETLAAIREGLRLVTQSPGGTSYRVFAGSGLDAAGKSGTAEDLAVGSDHVFFVAYAPREAPEVLALAALDEGKTGSGEAGPMVRKVLEAYLGR